MKIKTDFVTNSSSYSSTEIIIDNPVLLELVQQYKEIGVFADAELDFEVGSLVYIEGSKETTKTPAFSFEEHAVCCRSKGNPCSLNKVIECMIEVMDNYGDHGFDDDLYKQMKEELLEKKDEIMDGYVSVKWKTNDSSNEHDEDYNGSIGEIEEFLYDRTIGERSNYKKIIIKVRTI